MKNMQCAAFIAVLGLVCATPHSLLPPPVLLGEDIQ